MEIMIWILLSVLICSCAVFSIWAVRGALITPVRSSPGNRLYAVVAVSGGPENLEQTIDGLLWLIRSGTLKCEIIIVDAGMDSDSRAMAALLARDDERIHLCGGSLRFTEDSWRKTDT